MKPSTLLRWPKLSLGAQTRTSCTSNTGTGKSTTVLTTISDSGLKLNKAKCHFGKSEIQYFGHVISAGDMKPDPNKVKAVTQMPSPTNVEELRQVLGLINYAKT